MGLFALRKLNFAHAKMSDLKVSGWEDAVSGGALNSLSQTYWDFGNTVGELEQTSDERWRLRVMRLMQGWSPVNEWSPEEFDKVFSVLLPVGFEPELETEKFCFFEKEQLLFLQVIGKDGRTYIIHPDTNTVLKKKQKVSP